MLPTEQLIASGLRPFPCWTRYNEAKQRWDKGPALPRGASWQTVDSAACDWSTTTVAGVPVPEGIVILDLDTYKAGFNADAIHALLGDVPWESAHIQTTVGGGQHYAFRVPVDWKVRQGTEIGGTPLDTRTGGHGFICTGQGYTPAGFGVLRLAYPETLPVLPDNCRPALEHTTPAASTPTELPTSDRDIETITAALEHIDPGSSRDVWFRIGLALRHHFHDDEHTGYSLFDQWSSGELWPAGCPENYNGDTIQGQWNSFKPEGGTTIGSLFYMAAAAGWTPPASIDTAAAFGADAAPAEQFNAIVDRLQEHGGDTKYTAELMSDVLGTPCNTLQRATLLALLTRELKEAGLLTKTLAKQINKAAGTPYQSPIPVQPAGTILAPDMPMRPECWARFHTKGKDNKPKGTLDNFRIMLAAYGVNVRYDEVSKNVQITGPGLATAGTLAEEAALSYLDHLANLNDYPKAENRAMVMSVANQNTFNPVSEWLASAPWDGQDRITQLFQCLTLDPEECPQAAEMLFRKWIRGAVAIGTGITSKMEYVLTLVDPQGGAGKTRFFTTLCPPALRKDSLTLDTTNKDSIKTATSYWLIELGELDGTFNRSDQARLKSHLSAEEDEIRLPYGRAYLRYPRRTAYFASVNGSSFLVDDSGNRRFWPIRITRADHRHGIDMQQVWAQAHTEVQSGNIWHLTDTENDAISSRNEEFKAHSRVADALSAAYGGYNGEPCERHVTTTECLALAGIYGPSKADLNEGAAWLRRKGFVQRKRTGKRGFMVPEHLTPTAAAFKPQLVK